MGRVATLETILDEIAPARQDGATVVLTNGAFDMLHVGHLRYLQGAGGLGDIFQFLCAKDRPRQTADLAIDEPELPSRLS